MLNALHGAGSGSSRTQQGHQGHCPPQFKTAGDCGSECSVAEAREGSQQDWYLALTSHYVTVTTVSAVPASLRGTSAMSEEAGSGFTSTRE